MAEERKVTTAKAHKIVTEVRDRVVDLLDQDWSPEQISGRLKCEEIYVSTEWIYQYIWADKKRGGQLYEHLRHRAKRYHHRGAIHAGRGCIPHRIDIRERPAIVDTKTRLGDWEIDLIIGAKQQGVILSLVDRCSKYTLLASVPNKTAEAVTAAVLSCFRRLSPHDPGAMVQTITADNGKEFAGHQAIAKALHCSFFFATPYHSWERGLSEHTNGLVRQYFSKKFPLLNIPSPLIQFVENRINNRPRKVLQFFTPLEVLLRSSSQINYALAS